MSNGTAMRKEPLVHRETSNMSCTEARQKPEGDIAAAPRFVLLEARERRCYNLSVTETARKILNEALTLDADERAGLVAELLASLQESEQDVEKAWAAEIERRSRDAAEERGTDWRVALDEIRADVLRR